MNEKMKKLGLLIVAAIAMAMGVNSASALTIGEKTNNFVDPVTDNSGRKVNVVETAVNTYTINVVDSAFNAGITIYAGENVTINLNGKTLASEVSNNGSLTFVGDASSYMIGTLYNNTNNTTLNVEGGNYARMEISGVPSVYHIRVVGTVFPSLLKNGVKQSEGFKYVENGDGTITVLEADANLSNLVAALTSTATHGYGYYLAHETDYTKSSFAKYKEAYDIAQALRDENRKNAIPVSRQAEIDNATAAYIAAAKGLEKLGYYNNVMNAIAASEAKLNDGHVWTDASIAALREAIDAVVYDLPESKNDEIGAMYLAIVKAYDNLTVKADYSRINDLEAWVDSIGADKFTADSYAVYAFAQSVIERDLDSNHQYIVNDYYENLFKAAKGLKLAANAGTIVTPGSDNQTDPDVTNPDVTDPAETNPGTTNPGTTEGGNNNSGSTVNPNTGATGTTSDVNTSDNVAVYAVMNIASLIALAGCGLVLRKQN